MAETIKTQVVVLGSGPGGYSAAFRAADLGLEVTLVEQYTALGGVCLNVGCIPSKALLHVAQVIHEAEHARDIGVTFAPPKQDLDQIRAFKHSVVKKLTQGVSGMAKSRKVQVVQGRGSFTGSHQLSVTNEGKETLIEFVGFHRSAGIVRRAQAPVNYRRGHYRVGDGHGVSGIGQ